MHVSRYPLPDPDFLSLPEPDPDFFSLKISGFRVVTTCCFQSRIISMMAANQLKSKRNSLMILKIDRNVFFLSKLLDQVSRG